MDKLTLAHDYYMQHIKVGKYVSEGEAWNYADAMLEELEKRKDKTLPDALWQPDWSLAPEWAEAWAMDSDGRCSWFRSSKHMVCGDDVWYGTYLEKAPNFNYTGNWRNSLRIRPSSK